MDKNLVEIYENYTSNIDINPIKRNIFNNYIDNQTEILSLI